MSFLPVHEYTKYLVDENRTVYSLVHEELKSVGISRLPILVSEISFYFTF
jgi:hypothetical protein